MHGLDVVGPGYTGVALLCKQISPEKQFYLVPVNNWGEFGLIFIFDDIFSQEPRRATYTASLCHDRLKVKESFPVPEDNKWCVVMTLSD